MRIALVSDGVPPYVIGGMQKHSLNLLRNLAAEGVDIDFFHYKPGPSQQLPDIFSDTDRKQITEHLVHFPEGGNLPGHYIRNSKKYSENCFETYQKLQPADLIYCKGFTAMQFATAKQKGMLKAPLLVNFHGYEMFQKAPDFRSRLQQKWLLQKPVMKVLKAADGVMSYGGRITDLLQSIGIGKDKIIAIPGGIEASWIAEQIQPAQGIRKFAFVGRFERRKGIVELHQALGQMDLAGMEFTFVGPVPEAEQLKHPSVTYLGEIRDSGKIREVLLQSEVLVCPSYSEGMPNVILEAMACGCAVVATDVGAVATCVDAENGMIIKPGSATEIQMAMQRFAAMNAVELDGMRRNSIEKIKQQFTWNRIAAAHIRAFENTIQKTSPK